MSFKVFVGNLPFRTTGDDLAQIFGQVGAVSSAKVIQDKMTGRSRGFGFVEMETHEAVEAAVSRFNGTDLDGRKLTVNEAKPESPRESGNSNSGGGGRGRDRNW